MKDGSESALNFSQGIPSRQCGSQHLHELPLKRLYSRLNSPLFVFLSIKQCSFVHKVIMKRIEFFLQLTKLATLALTKTFDIKNSGYFKVHSDLI